MDLPLHELPISVLRSIHRSALGVESTMRDRKKLARKLANIALGDGEHRDAVRRAIVDAFDWDSPEDHPLLAAVERFRKAMTANGTEVTITTSGPGLKRRSVTLKPDDNKAVRDINHGSTATRINSAISQLDPDRARKLLSDVGGSFLAEEALKQQKKAANKEIKERISGHWSDMAEATRDAAAQDDPVASLLAARKALDAIEADERELKEVSKEFNADIKEEREKIKRTLQELNQRTLPGIE